MRILPVLYFALLGPTLAGEQPANHPYPLWDGSESVAEYAKKVKLPPTQTLDLGNGVNLELMLIPAGKFVMGTPEPTPVDEEVFHKKILTGQALLAVSGFVLLVMLLVVAIKAIRKKCRPQVSLMLLLLVTVAAGGCVLSGVHWGQSVRGLEAAGLDFIAAKARYDAESSDEKPAHSVTLTQPFYMGKYDVTQEQYQQVIGTNPSHFKGKDNPVETVSWVDAQAFCKKLTEQSKQTIRLPTEAEWEFACRAGTTTSYYSGDMAADLARVAWYSGNDMGTRHPVGQKEANFFGLFDMHGKCQWCEDWWDENRYSISPDEDPQGPAQGAYRVFRGGSWNPVRCRSAWRRGKVPTYHDNVIGFRVLMTPGSRTP
jgi:formylglycine-generating enzyme required for sulfatase activity